MTLLIKPVGSDNIKFIREHTKFVDGSGVYPELTIPEHKDASYAGFQSPFIAIRETGTDIESSQDYYLYGGKLPYNVYPVGTLPLPSGGISPDLRRPLVPSGQISIPEMSGYIFSIDTIVNDRGAYRIKLDPEIDPIQSFGITRYEFYDFEGERREIVDFILNPEIRNVSGIILSQTTVELKQGDSIELSFYAGLIGDQNLSNRFTLSGDGFTIIDGITPSGVLVSGMYDNKKIFPVEWAVVENFGNPPADVNGTVVELSSKFGPVTKVTALENGLGQTIRLEVLRDRILTTTYEGKKLRQDIISEGVADELTTNITNKTYLPEEALPISEVMLITVVPSGA